MDEPLDITAAIAEVDDLNDLCRVLREGYLKHHPDAPPSPEERDLVEAALYVRQHHGIDWTSRLGVLPNALRKRIAEATR